MHELYSVGNRKRKKKVDYAIASDQKAQLPFCRGRFQQEQRYMEETDLLIDNA